MIPGKRKNIGEIKRLGKVGSSLRGNFVNFVVPDGLRPVVRFELSSVADPWKTPLSNRRLDAKTMANLAN